MDAWFSWFLEEELEWKTIGSDETRKFNTFIFAKKEKKNVSRENK